VGQPGIEPGTSVLSGLRSNRLSYWPKAGAGGGGTATAEEWGGADDGYGSDHAATGVPKDLECRSAAGNTSNVA
jgi:hypothetical protein